jgi:PAS domain S-box-containing protein
VIELSTYSLELLRNDKELNLYRGRSEDEESNILVLSPAVEYPAPELLKRLEHEYFLREELDSAWAARPIAITHYWDRTVLVLEDPGGVPLDQLLGQTLDLAFSLRLAVGLSSAIGHLHQRGIIHKDIKPANVLADPLGRCWLKGFGIASRLPRERQSAEPPDSVAGTLAYMAPEQTGRMNRSTDCRSDLYALGVSLYEMLTGTLPFAASDPMEWVHCHIARKPLPPEERSRRIPASVSAIVMKLLAKIADERYQTAAGVEVDLQHCLAEWQTQGQVPEFKLGEHDMPDQLLIPEKLYGRAREIAALLASFERVVTSGRPELVLVSGYSGIGKSSVVNELHRALVPPRGLFASGKFDRYKRDIPYSTLAQAFQGLIRPLLGRSDAELSPWRDDFQEALGANGQLIVDLVPELALIIGQQPPVPELAAQDAQRRFQLVFRRFIGVFARPEHPLALFLDDLQWLDAATLDLLEDLSTQSDVQHLMVIGAYRDNEVDRTHPLVRKLESIRQAGAIVQEIVLTPLSCEDLGRLIADSLHCEPENGPEGVTPLAQLVHEKTGGNPFFAIQFLSALADEGLLTFDHSAGRWSWDLTRIHAKGYTDNVVDLMVGKLNRLPVETRETLKEFACLGSRAQLNTLSIVQGASEEKVQSHLWEALRLEFVVRSDGSYKFVHDRIQEAAYSLIPEELRAETHLRIGRLLTAQTSPGKLEEAVFEIVSQLNRGARLISSRVEREQLAELNLLAGKRARASTAYTSALKYFMAGAAVLADDCWERQHELIFALELYRAECEFLTGELRAAEERLTMLSCLAAKTVERARVECLRIDLYTKLDQTDRAVGVCLDYLRHLGIEWSLHPTEEEARREYDQIWIKLGSRAIEELIELPLMSDPESLATLDVLTKVYPSALKDANLLSMAVCRAVNLSLERGHSDGSCAAYEFFGKIAGPRFGDYKAGFRFGQLGYELVEQRGLERFQARTYLWFGQFVVPWTKHVRSSRALFRRAFEAATKAGDITFAVYSFDNLNTNFLAAGDPLIEAQRQAENGLDFAERLRFGHVIDIITTQLGLIRTLRGLTYKFGCFDDGQLSEAQLEQHVAGNPVAKHPECWYWIRKLQARFFAGDYPAALDAAVRGGQLLWSSAAMFETAEFHLYTALARAAVYDTAALDSQREHFKALAKHHKQLAQWAENCPENFENRAALVGAEIARIEGRDQDAMRLYEQAIDSARANGFVNNEAVANEVAARFYLARGFKKIAYAYLRYARYCYLRWGADGKVRQLDELYPQIRQEETASAWANAIGAPLKDLDFDTVVRASQAISSEIVLQKLIRTLMQNTIEHAGAERGLLILPRGSELRIAAESTTSGDRILVHLQEAPVIADALPESIVHYVVRTQEIVILDDALVQNPFSTDRYIQHHHARSILCLPLIKQARLIGVLYLENNLAPHVFTPARIAVLKLLASQAAISLENTYLYRDLEGREAKIRRLVDANIVGIFIWNLDGKIIEANEAFLKMVNYSREDLVSGRLNWKNLTPPEWRDLTERAVAKLKATGIVQPYEKEYYRNDGSRIPVLVGSAVFEEGENEGVAFVLDLSERKRSEEALQRRETDLREAQAELAHVSRVATMGELTASIAHEVNQPLSAALNNASACVRWLAANDLEEARQSASLVISNVRRAGEIIAGIRALAKKAPPRKEPLDINETIREVFALVRNVLHSNHVSLETDLANDLPLIIGDRVQLQQVILNLLINAIEAMAEIEEEPRILRVSSKRTIELSDNSEHVLIAVRDSGPGLDMKSLNRLFDTFYTTKPQGLGMGLAISRSIIEAHGGRLWAENAVRGAVFQFALPIFAEAIGGEK